MTHTVHLSRKAVQLQGALMAYLTPRLAMDHRAIDVAPILSSVTLDNYESRRAGIVAAVKEQFGNKLARGASLAGTSAILDALDEADTEYASCYGEPMSMDSKPAFDVAAYGRRCTAKALRNLGGRSGLAADSDQDEPPVNNGVNGKTIDKMIAHGAKNFSPDDWLDFRGKAEAAHQDCIDRMPGDEPEEKPAATDTPPETGKNGIAERPDLGAADASFLNRYPSTFRIGKDDGFGRHPRVIGREQSSAERARFDAMFPGASRIKGA
jgi:hypothetical protein